MIDRKSVLVGGPLDGAEQEYVPQSYTTIGIVHDSPGSLRTLDYVSTGARDALGRRIFRFVESPAGGDRSFFLAKTRDWSAAEIADREAKR